MQDEKIDERIQKLIFDIISKCDEPLETREIEGKVREKFADFTHSMIIYRLTNLRGEGKIRGKRLAAGAKGVWVWWRTDAFG
ncbi:MAG: hypothetical protein V1836_02255 [Candidatus Aenigmatarchaeota archaeon]